MNVLTHLSRCSGYFADTTGMTSCTQCPQGQVGYIAEQDAGVRTSQNTECRLCPKGTSRDGTRSSKQTKATMLTDGSEYACTQASCTGCLLCAKGSYALAQGMVSCETCVDGKIGKGTDDVSTPASERATEAAACEPVSACKQSHPPPPTPRYPPNNIHTIFTHHTHAQPFLPVLTHVYHPPTVCRRYAPYCRHCYLQHLPNWEVPRR
jgi:hypothetical protein